MNGNSDYILKAILNGRGYIAGESIAAGVADFAVVQLWNPENSYMRIVVFELNWYPTGPNATIHRFTTRPLSGVSTRGIVPLHSQGASPKGQIRAEYSPTNPFPNEFPGAILTLQTTTPFRRPIPYVIMPGYGLTIAPSAINLPNQGSFYWIEDPLA